MLLCIFIVSSLIKCKIKVGLGLFEVKICVSGLVLIFFLVIIWFVCLGVEICEGWGMIENVVLGIVLLLFCYDKIGCIGYFWSGVDIKLLEEGELLVKFWVNMFGYYLDEEKIKEVFIEDGYLCIGDKVMVDVDNYYKIIGWIKDIFKMVKGKYVMLVFIEVKLMENVLIE